MTRKCLKSSKGDKTGKRGKAREKMDESYSKRGGKQVGKKKKKWPEGQKGSEGKEHQLFNREKKTNLERLGGRYNREGS